MVKPVQASDMRVWLFAVRAALHVRRYRTYHWRPRQVSSGYMIYSPGTRSILS